MLLGYAPCSLGVNYPTGNAVTGRQYLDEVAAAGNRATEFGPLGYLPKDPGTDRGELARRGLTPIGATYVHIVGDRSAAPDLMAMLRQLAALLLEGEFGLKATCHPHIGTAVEFGGQIDRLPAETDIRLLADFARLAMGRMRRTHGADIERLQALEGSKQ
jgi:inosose dehydratase